jgi:DNA-binding GntR family transcriptional regulator
MPVTPAPDAGVTPPRPPHHRAGTGTATDGAQADRAALGHVTVARTGTDQVADILREAIVEGQLAPGSLHSVRELAEQLGVSRTPVREALLQLARDRMVRFERNRGVRIMQTTMHDLDEIFEIREWLEVPATARAAERCTPMQLRTIERALHEMRQAVAADDEERLWRHDRAFHRAILLASGNTRLADYVDGLRDMVLFRDSTTVRKGRTPQAVLDEHLPVMAALSAKDPTAAARAMAQHIVHTKQLLLSTTLRLDDGQTS